MHDQFRSVDRDRVEEVDEVTNAHDGDVGKGEETEEILLMDEQEGQQEGGIDGQINEHEFRGERDFPFPC